MRRLDVVELMDLPRLPRPLRDGITGALRASEELFHPYDGLVDRLADLLGVAERRRIVDLCSGAGGPAPALFRQLRAAGVADELVLTDRFPHATAGARLGRAEGVTYRPQPMDATAVDPDLLGVRTMFNALHHLAPDAAAAVLRDAAAARQPLLVVETLARSPAGAFGAVNAALSCFATLPVPGPGWLARVLLTWPVPILPAVLLWEGLASCARCYREDELRAMLPRSPGYDYVVERLPVPHLPLVSLTLVVGRPTG